VTDSEEGLFLLQAFYYDDDDDDDSDDISTKAVSFTFVQTITLMGM
jgi:hypothetical protein